MTQGTTQTKGTKIYFGYAPNASSSDPDGIVILAVACPTGLTGLSAGEAARTDITCLDSVTREYVAGLQDLPSINVPVNVINRSESHQALMDAELKNSELILPFLVVAGAHDIAPTTLDSDGFLEWTGENKAQRRWKGYVSNWSEDYAVGDIIKGTVTIQLSTRIHRQHPTADLP